VRLLSTQLLLLATLPPLLGQPQDNLQQVAFQVQQVGYEERKAELDYPFSYDGIMRFLHDLQSGELEKRCTPEDLEKITQFLAFLARAGVLPEDTEENRSLEGDIEELLDGESDSYDYMMIPAVSHGYGEMILCKHRSWAEKKWDQVTHFAKKHEKALIIGSVVIVGVAVVVVAVATAPASVGAAAASAVGAIVSPGSDSSGSHKQERRGESHHSVSIPNPPEIAATQEAPTLKAVMDQEVISFKEQVVHEQFFQNPYPFSQQQALSWEENGRVLGSLFAHESLQNIEQQITDSPRLSQEVQTLGFQYDLSISPEHSLTPLDFGHPEIDRIFSTDYTSLFAIPEADFQTLSYQVRGERALACGYYDQAVQDLGRAIELNPTNPLPYLERGVAHFGLGQYDLLLEDYHTFSSQVQKTYPLSIPDFGRGFAKGLPKGIYDSGEGIFLLVSDLARHPIHTGRQMWDALTLLSELARSEEWSTLSEVLAPEIHKLVKEWETLPSNVRGELAGYAFGKYGADIIIPGALAKAVSRGLKGAQKVSAVYRGLQTTEQTLLLESVAALESGTKIAEVVQLEKQVSSWLGEGTKVIHNAAGDPVFLSEDGIRKVRFDFNRPYPHENPHLHLEELIDGEWKEISRIYPSDVPHK